MPLYVAITRVVRPGCEAEFTSRLRVFVQQSLGSGGVLGAHMLVPPPGSREFGILRSFASAEEREAFYQSPLFRQWQEDVAPLVEADCRSRDLHGMEAWFREGGIPRPPRWKMAIVTLLGVYPASLILGALLGPLLADWPRAVSGLVIAAAMVVCLTWLIMPGLTTLLRRWLHRAGVSDS